MQPFSFVRTLTLLTSLLGAAQGLVAADEGSVRSEQNATATFLNKVREANLALYSDLRSFVCDEHIVRYRGYVDGSKARQLDTVSASVSFENGVEQYTDIAQNREPRASMSDLGGAWSVGEFGTLLRQTEQLLGTSAVSFRQYSTVDGTSTAVYSFDTSDAESPWELQIRGERFVLPFHTEVYVSRLTGQIVKLERSTNSVPLKLGLSEIRWSLSLKPAEMNGQIWLLPSTARYAVLYRGTDRLEWNEIQFAGYHRYGSEASIRYQ